jgi:hypothetical protein
MLPVQSPTLTAMGDKFEAWKNADIPEAMYLTRTFRDVAIAYEEAKADPTQDTTQEEYVAALLATTLGAITQIEGRLLTLEGVDFVPPDWQPPTE